MRYQRRFGFSLVEVLVVMAVIGVLIGLMLNAIQSVRGAAGKIACANHLRQIGIAAQAYEGVHRHVVEVGHKIPSTFTNSKEISVLWTVTLLPYLEQEAIYREAIETHKVSWPNDNPPNVHLATVVKVYTCPDDYRLAKPITDDLGITAAYASYIGVAGDQYKEVIVPGGSKYQLKNRGAMYGDRITMSQISDGTSSTVMLGENVPRGRNLAGNWYTYYIDPLKNQGAGVSNLIMYDNLPDLYYENWACKGPFQFGPALLSNPCDSQHFGSLHRSGGHFLFCDGSVRNMPYSAVDIMPALASRAGGEVVDLP